MAMATATATATAATATATAMATGMATAMETAAAATKQENARRTKSAARVGDRGKGEELSATYPGRGRAGGRAAVGLARRPAQRAGRSALRLAVARRPAATSSSSRSMRRRSKRSASGPGRAACTPNCCAGSTSAGISDVVLRRRFLHAVRSRLRSGVRRSTAQRRRIDGAARLQATRRRRCNLLQPPAPQFRDHAWPAIVNVAVEPDGLVRRYTFGQKLDNEFLPSMGAVLAGQFDANSPRS